jgi:predicted DNA-binding transcriptional regulator AlpA
VPEDYLSRYLSPKEVSTLLGVSVSLLEKWRASGFGPPFLKINERLIRYRDDCVEAWMSSLCSEGGVKAGSDGNSGQFHCCLKCSKALI